MTGIEKKRKKKITNQLVVITDKVTSTRNGGFREDLALGTGIARTHGQVANFLFRTEHLVAASGSSGNQTKSSM